MPDGMEMGMQMDMGQASPQEQPYGGPGMQAPPLPSPMGGGAAPIPQGMGEASQQAYGRYIAEHGQEAVVQLQQLDRAAKFRRALSMIQETFATITGREDIAARVRQQIVQEDHQRAAQVETQILARVGAQQIHEEQLAAAAERKKAEAAGGVDRLKFEAQHRAGAMDDATKILPFTMDEQGNHPTMQEAQEGLYQQRIGGQTDFFTKYHYDKAGSELAAKGKEEKVLGPERAAQAGRETRAREQATTDVRTNPANVKKEATREATVHPKEPKDPKAEKADPNALSPTEAEKKLKVRLGGDPSTLIEGAKKREDLERIASTIADELVAGNLSPKAISILRTMHERAEKRAAEVGGSALSRLKSR